MSLKTVTPLDGCAWITGASSGIGAALALELASRGWQVAISARRKADLAAIAKGQDNITAFVCDVTDRDAMATTAQKIEKELGPIALGIMNAGIYLPTAFPEFEAEIFDRTFEVNLTGTVNGLAALMPLMVARGMGHLSRWRDMAACQRLLPMALRKPPCLTWASRWRWI